VERQIDRQTDERLKGGQLASSPRYRDALVPLADLSVLDELVHGDGVIWRRNTAGDRSS